MMKVSKKRFLKDLEESVELMKNGRRIPYAVLEEYFDENETYDGDDPKCDQEYVARCRENWGGIWNG